MSQLTQMRLNQYYDGTWRVLIILCAAMVWVSNSAAIWTVAPPFVASFLVTTGILNTIKRFSTLWIAFLIGLGSFMSINQFSFMEDLGDIASAMISLVVGFLPITLTFKERVTSYWLSVLNVIIISLGCIIITNELSIYIFLFLFLGIIIFNMNAATLMFMTNHSAERVKMLPPRFFLQFISVLPVGLLATAAIFFSFPRVNSLGLALQLGSTNNQTGYTGSISLSQGRSIDQSQALALLVDHSDKRWLRKVSGRMLLRGKSLDQFDGRGWELGADERVYYNKQAEFRLNNQTNKRPRDLTFYIEPTRARAIFYPDALVGIAPPKTNLKGIYTNRRGDFFRGTSSYERFFYQVKVMEVDRSGAEQMTLDEVETRLTALPEIRLSPFELSEADLPRYLKLPASIQEAEYFQEYLKGISSLGPFSTVGDLFVGISLYFQRNYEASLINDFSSADTLKSFLTTDKRGHCEYFASATVLALRAFGIPARVVAGYRGGVYNQVSQLVEVRELNAHAWLEMFIPGEGWVSFDPTPLGPPGGSIGFVAGMKQYFNAVSFWFNKYVVDYNRETQKNLFVSISQMRVRDRAAEKWTFEWLRETLMDFAGVVGVIALLTFLYYYRKRRRMKHLPKYYRYFLMRHVKGKWVKAAGESFRDFHQRLIAEGVNKDIVELVDRALECDLYASEQHSNEESQVLKTLKEAA